MEKQSGDMAFFAGLVAGAIVGGAVAALLVPRSGPETTRTTAGIIELESDISPIGAEIA